MQLNQDGDLGPMHAMYGAPEAELEVQCTINRLELRAICVSSARLPTPPRFMWIINGLLMVYGKVSSSA